MKPDAGLPRPPPGPGPMLPGAWPAWLTAVAGVCLLALSAVHLAAHLAQPSDGTQVDFNAAVETPGGLAVLVKRPAPGGLQTGDVVLALDDRPLDDWLVQGLWQPFAPAGPAAGPLRYAVLRAGQVLTVSQPLARYPLAAILGANWTTTLFTLYLEVVSLAVFSLRPRLRQARAFFLLSSAILGSTLIFFPGLQVADLRSGWLVWLYLWGSVGLYVLLVSGLVHFCLVFPSPREAIVRRPRLIGLIYLGGWLTLFLALLAGWGQTASASGHLQQLVQATTATTAAGFLTATIVVLLALRQFRGASERRQIRWFTWGFVAANVPWLALNVLPSLLGWRPLLSDQVVGLLWLILPTTFAIAILRERLFDIDVVINRSLVYGALSLLLALTYFGSVVVLQRLSLLLTGQAQAEWVTVVSTLAIAALFAPVRSRIQVFIDRRFYRRKYNAAQSLAAFAASVRQEVDVDRLAGRLLEVVQEAMEPAHAGLWLIASSRKGRPHG